MDLQINTAAPLIMHIDLNSCFATIEQQANPLLRGKPIAVAAHKAYFGCILSPSIEAKRYGIKVGMRVKDAQLIYPNIVVLTPDPPKYREAHRRFMKIFRDYSPDVIPKSIDEAIIDFSSVVIPTEEPTPAFRPPLPRGDQREVPEGFCKPFRNGSTVGGETIMDEATSSRPARILPPLGRGKGVDKNIQNSKLVFVAREIKQRIRSDLGEWVSCSIGIGTNRWWAKLGAGLHKPDGLDIITHENIRTALSTVSLLDLCGINVRYQVRLNQNGIYTPLQFLDAPLIKLQKQVFKSIGGYYWYLRLRGWEIDSVEFDTKSYGQQHALTSFDKGERDLLGILMKLCEKMGRRLRRDGQTARGIHVGCGFRNHTYWHHGQSFHEAMYTTYDLYQRAVVIFQQRPSDDTVTRMDVRCFDLHPARFFQNELFDEKKEKRLKVSQTLDTLNDRYGEYKVHPATMMKMEKNVIDRVPFGKAGIGE